MRPQSSLHREFERAGFTLVRWSKHLIWRCPCGHAQVVTPASPGEGRSAYNTTALLARTVRACKAQPLRECA